MRLILLLLVSVSCFAEIASAQIQAPNDYDCGAGWWPVSGPRGELKKFERLIDIANPRDTRIILFLGTGRISLFQLKITLADNTVETVNYPTAPRELVRTLKRLDIWFQQTNERDTLSANVCAQFLSKPQ